MSSLLQLVTCLLLIGACSCSHFDRPPANAQEGDPCTPSNPKRCGDLMLVSETVTALSEADGFGPNLCRTRKTYETGTYSYTYQRRCFGRFCYLHCRRTASCDGNVVNVTKTEVNCCDGFGVDPSQTSSGGYFGGSYHGSGYSHSYSLKRNGCPIMLRDSVLDCLVDLDLTSVFSELGNVPEFLTILGSNGDSTTTTNQRSYTFFAPSNEAFVALSDLERGSSRMILGGHIINGSRPIFSNRLRTGQILTPIDKQYSLHVTTNSSRSNRDVYLNGARINQTAACQARNGIVYVMDSVIPLSNQTIAQVLDTQDRFSIFSRLLNSSGIVRHLQKNGKSRTVFAPTNDAFSRLPTGALECLLRDSSKKSLKQFIYIHIIYPTEYNSTLSQRKHVRTFTSRPNYWLVITAEGGTIRVTRDMIIIEELDIPASNGVIHALPEPIVAIDLQRLCPDIVGITTEPPVVIGPTGIPVGPGNTLNAEGQDM